MEHNLNIYNYLVPRMSKITILIFRAIFRKVFNSREDLLKYVHDTALSLGFITKIESSNMFALFAKPRLLLACDRSETYDSIKPSTKDTGTKKCGCPFRLKGRKNDKYWRIEVVCGKHNHSIITYMEGHAIAGRLTESELEIVKTMHAHNIKARQILGAIKKENPQNKSTVKTIHNALAKLKIAESDGRTQVQQLLYLLENNSYVRNLRSDAETDELQDIFFAHTRSIELFKAFPYVLLMDCTYNTNIFKLPLFEIIGVTSTTLTFSVAFVLMQSEKKDNYIWALDCLKQIMADCQLPRVILTDRDAALMHAVDIVFPTSSALLCKWHISKNVYDRARKIIRDDVAGFCNIWRCIVYSTTLEEYQENIQLMGSTFERYPGALKYIGELLDHYKKRSNASFG